MGKQINCVMGYTSLVPEWEWKRVAVKLSGSDLASSPHPYLSALFFFPQNSHSSCLRAFAHPIPPAQTTLSPPQPLALAPAHPLGFRFDVASLGESSLLTTPTPGLDHVGAFSFFSFISWCISIIIIMADVHVGFIKADTG